MSDSILITEPVSIRSYVSGGKGGYGGSSSPWHRLTERRAYGDLTACGVLVWTSKTVVKPGRPSKRDAEKYGLCERCW